MKAPNTARRSAIPPRWLLTGMLALLLSACGFQPRGQSVGAGQLPGPMAISGIRVNSPLYRELRKQIADANGTLVSTIEESTAILRISRHASTSRVLSLDSRNRAVEYELEESARFALQGTAGETLLPDQTLRVLRILFRPSEAILSSDREAELLRADMRRDLVARMLRRASATDLVRIRHRPTDGEPVGH